MFGWYVFGVQSYLLTFGVWKPRVVVCPSFLNVFVVVSGSQIFEIIFQLFPFLGDGFKDFLFSSLFGEIIHFD